MLKEISDFTGVNYTFVISIDGCTKDTYEKTRINSNFEKVIENAIYFIVIERLFSYK